MKIIFMGTPDYATEILRQILIEGIEVLAVFTNPDRPVGRKQILTPPSVKLFLQENGYKIDIFQPKNLRDEDIIKKIKELNPDFIVVAAYGKILTKDILQIAPCINLHASVLPKYRGASPIQSALLAGEKQTGVTTMLMNEGLDTGDMLEFEYTTCEYKTSKELFDELARMAGRLIISTLKNFNNLKHIKQDEGNASYCKKITKQMGLVSFKNTTAEIYNKFRAFDPWPGIFLENGLKIIDLKPSNKKGNCEEIIDITEKSFFVATHDFSVEIFSIQEPGKKAVKAIDFINGKRLKVGSRIS
ncbi:methionyl-tRNA formyltransferase [Campylobacter pinnipediorum]|uniref:Methionyl-tRNA formyltransferase n=1 Tax=Campylobacter pinnipediorum subsp. pinnipediorum TaxID=1660067 RepID=A0AAX0LB90_9BACT|nr:methionyl-tRNA formyltransferase [Campylobacter pinnipediorum]AQW83242.1 10-formyltetrahydrofolate:L-methionyl-tRNA(fMet) N-formyltransferase [Campylobacter pinnipediorum subsp. pinnipediorum]OPA81726.1 methionyl-tRNA formyltransferase [Campylobacter pinnipediorum subsp. pinnipediorum]